MKQLDAILKSPTARGLAVNLTVAIVVPMLVTAVAPFVRPVGRSVLKTGILAVEKLRETASELGELVEDLTAEVQEELQQRRERAAGLVDSERGTDNRTDNNG